MVEEEWKRRCEEYHPTEDRCSGNNKENRLTKERGKADYNPNGDERETADRFTGNREVTKPRRTGK